MLLAQGLSEYGALTGVASGLGNFFENIEYTIRDAGLSGWTMIGFGVFVLWFLLLRKR